MTPQNFISLRKIVLCGHIMQTEPHFVLTCRLRKAVMRFTEGTSALDGEGFELVDVLFCPSAETHVSEDSF
jgi:hypothetical protein